MRRGDWHQQPLRCHMCVYQRADSPWGAADIYCCRGKAKVGGRHYHGGLLKKGCCRCYLRKGCQKRWWDIPQGQVVLETRLDLCHRLFPAEIRKTWRKVSWLLVFLLRTAHLCQAAFPAWHRTFRQGDEEAGDARLLTRGPAFPRAPGTPGKPWLP